MTHKQIFKKRNYYINIFGTYLIEVFLDPHVSENLDLFYKHIRILTPETLLELQAIVAKRGRTKIVISNNARKAEKIIAKLKKPFYFPVKK